MSSHTEANAVDGAECNQPTHIESETIHTLAAKHTGTRIHVRRNVLTGLSITAVVSQHENMLQ
jgi:hypothetical protein